ncbi:glycogen debranching enzyme-like isoform X2 [Littorina saxatilis]|uniref:glycogen debranching enzyme-like isoform X2 n=1 Tax=Littorina saxatilis TaxID=31220 RepID=UPI0038B52303
MSKLLYPKPGELGIVWGDKVICCLETGLPELIEVQTQTELDEETQTGCPRCSGRGEGPAQVEQPSDKYQKNKPRFFGNVHQMDIQRRTRDSMPTHQVRVHHLNKGENKESTLYRLEKGWVLRFLLSPSLHSLTVRLFCNHPPDPQTPFDRRTYHELEWKCPTGMRSDLTDIYAELQMLNSGSFNYFFTIDESTCIGQANGQGFFLVEPVLSVGRDEEITMDCLQVQTVITKLLGPFNEWESRLAVARETGYNVIHFTPVQELGISNSAYSIRDQLRFSPVYSTDERNVYTMNDLESLIAKMHKEWRVLSITDLVLNHTSKDSPWLMEHPECAYNCNNSPHLKPAYIIDRIFHYFSQEIAKGKWESQGIPPSVTEEGHLQAMRHVLHNEIFPKHKISEFYKVDVDNVMKEFKKAVDENRSREPNESELKIKQDPEFGRMKSSIDLNHAVYRYNTDRGASETGSQGDQESPSVLNRSERVEKCCESLRDHLEHLNRQKEAEICDHINQAIENFIANARYRFVADYGNRLGQVTIDEPLMHSYFVVPDSHDGGVEKAEQCMLREPQLVMAVNGWVMADDPLRNFAEGSNVYLRRELIAWGDSCKLRYGQKPADCPALWERMRNYAEITARIFHGVRLDNCHSTPVHVAEYMIDVARKVRPDLYVVAELFTGSESLDNLFMNRLGINSLIRESMTAKEAHEQGRLVYRFGGLPVGSFAQPRVRPLVPTVAHALFFDQTHDNPSPVQERSAYDLWPTAALVAMANCAIGSNRGYDQIVPHHIHVVNEERLYAKWGQDLARNENINLSVGINAGKRLLNNLHYELATGGFQEVFVDQLDHEVVAVTRHNPQTHQSVIVIARTAFHHPQNPDDQRIVRSVQVQGIVEEVLFEGCLRQKHGCEYTKDDKTINGLPNYYLEVREHVGLASSQYAFEQSKDNELKEVHIKNLVPGAVVAIKCSLGDRAKEAVLEIRRGMGQFGYMMRSYSGNTTYDDTWDKSNFRGIVSRLSLGDLNRVMYRVDQEERDDKFGFSTYNIPGHGNLCYSGLRGVMSVLGEVRPCNNLGHPLCNNLRHGDWLMDYISNRLKVIGNTLHLGEWFEGMFLHLKKVPRFLIPCYFDAIITGSYIVLREMALQQFSEFVKDGSTFVQALSMGSTQFCGFVRSAKLPLLSPNLDPKPRTEVSMLTNEVEEAPVSMAAGLPHFAAGFWRCWGRDTFIALRGMLLVTGRHSDARFLILAFGGTLRHGLIPNLLSEGKDARYNCRDAIWWWLQAIKSYTMMAPDGEKILNDPVARIFPTDEDPGKFPGKEQPLNTVMQEALAKHMSGLKYRERGAGSKLDADMSDEGFNVEIGVKWPQGYVFGGNIHNCGTWMDKMGSSTKAGNKGQPATPRDGSAVEIVGLCASVVGWLADMHAKGAYPHSGVKYTKENYTDELITFEKWACSIKDNFEKDFYIHKEPKPNEENPELIVRRGIYKDCFNASQFWSNFQLRPNFCVALVVAPELFNVEHAWNSLDVAEKVLLGPLGMKTLDPSDWAYDGDYCVSNDGNDPKLAHGFNYHNGPEWVWPLAYFLRAKLYYASKLNKSRPGILKDTVDFVDKVLCRHYQELMHSPWKSLPELTNSNGTFCADSCRAQAWSDGCILEVLYDLERIETASRPSVVNFQAALVKTQ